MGYPRLLIQRLYHLLILQTLSCLQAPTDIVMPPSDFCINNNWLSKLDQVLEFPKDEVGDEIV